MPDIISPQKKEFILEDGSRFEIDYSKVLGEGSYGKVYAGTYMSADGTIDNNVAIKVQLSEGLGKNFQKETEMNRIQKIVHNIHIADNNLYMVMPDLGKALPEHLDVGQNLTDDITEIQKNNKETIEVIEFSSEQKDSPDAEYDNGSDLSMGTFVEHDNDSDSPYGTFVEHDNDSDSPSGTFVEHDGSSESILGTTIEYDSNSDSPSGSFVQFESAEDDNKPFFLRQKFQNDGSSVNTVKPTLSLEDIPPKPFNMLDFNEAEHHLRLDETFDVFEKMAEEVERAHNNGILHLDIKSDNFLRDPKTGKISLIDFGVSRFISDNKKKVYTGTAGYMAPELIVKSPEGTFTAEQDVYSLGKTYLHILAKPLVALNKNSIVAGLPIPSAYMNFSLLGEYNKHRESLPELENFQFKNEKNNPEIHAMNQLVSLMNNMLQLKAENRPSIQDVKEAFNKMRSELKQADEKVYLQVLEEVPFKENKMESRFMAQTAIRHFNAQQLQAWRRQPENERAPQPVSLSVPENDKLDVLISAAKNNNQTKGQSFTSGKINVAESTKADKKTSDLDPEGIGKDQKNLGAQRVNLLIKDIVKRINECPAKKNQQRSGAFKSFVIQFQRDGEMGLLLKNLDNLSNNTQIDGPSKLEQLRANLQKSMDEYQKNTFSKSEKSEFYKVCKESVDNIDSLQSRKPSEKARNKM